MIPFPSRHRSIAGTWNLDLDDLHLNSGTNSDLSKLSNISGSQFPLS